jgi:hypothetical protein
MSVIHSTKLSQILEKKINAGLLKQARKHALWCEMLEGSSSSWTAGMDAIAQVLKILDKKHSLPCSVTTASVQKSRKRWWVFVYDCDEPTAIDRVEQEAVRGKVSPKVLARMVADRITKTADRIKYHKSHREADEGSTPTLTRELFTKEGFEKALDMVYKVRRYRHMRHDRQVPYLLSEVLFIVERDDMTPEIIDDGWNLYKVRGVMQT